MVMSMADIAYNRIHAATQRLINDTQIVDYDRCSSGPVPGEVSL